MVEGPSQQNMTITLPTKHFSATQSSMYARCGEQYRRRYVEGEIIPPAIAMLVGTGVHSAAQKNHEQKIVTHADLPTSDLQDIAATAYSMRAQEEGVFIEAENKLRAAEAVGEGKDHAVSITTLYAERCAPTIQPVLVEERSSFALPGLCDVQFVIDVVDDSERIRDLKTAGARKNQADADKSAQLTCYSLGYEALRGHAPSELRLDVLVRTSAGKLAYQNDLVSRRTHDDYQALINRMAAQVRAISAGVFPPADPENWACSPRFCGYWHTCPYVNREGR
jgi:hypothetical protein